MIKSSMEHLNDVNENYFEHMKIALSVSLILFTASIMALIHGFIPGFFKTGASSVIKKLYFKITNRK